MPALYGEGTPRSLLEAMAMGRPIITTNTPGCRETIIDKKNGFLIKPNNLKELVYAMRFFLKNENSINLMGSNSYLLAKDKFDVKK